MHERSFRTPCKTGDNAELTATLTQYNPGDGGGDDDYISFKTSRGKSVWVLMHDARELAGWLIEHASEDPDGAPVAVSPDLMTYAGASGSVGYMCARLGCKARGMQVSPDHQHEPPFDQQ